MNATLKTQKTSSKKVTNKSINLLTEAINNTKELKQKKSISDRNKQLERIVFFTSENCNVQRLKSLINFISKFYETNKDSFNYKDKLKFTSYLKNEVVRINKLELKNVDVSTLDVKVTNKVASDKQNKKQGFNTLVRYENKSLGKCLQIIQNVLEICKNEPNKIKTFKVERNVLNAFDMVVNKNITEYNVKFDAILYDIVSYTRKNKDMYSFLLERISLEITDFSETKVKEFIENNLPMFQDKKAEIKNLLASKK